MQLSLLDWPRASMPRYDIFILSPRSTIPMISLDGSYLELLFGHRTLTGSSFWVHFGVALEILQQELAR